MSFETLIADLTTAIKENTAAHAKLADVALAAANWRTTAPEETKSAKTAEPSDDEPKETAAEKKKRLAAEKRKADATKKAEKPELAETVTHDELHALAGKFLAGDDEEVRDQRKGNFFGALAHLGAKKLTELEDDTARARVAAYLTYWMADLEVDFDEIDALIPDAPGEEDPVG